MATAHQPETTRPQDSSGQSLMQAQRQQIIGLLMLLSALVLFVAPWIANYPDTAKEAHRNELGVGIIVFFLALIRFFRYPGKWPDLVVLAAGAWMIISPWAFSAQKTEVFDGAHVIDTVTGTVLVVLASLSLLLLKLTKRNGAREEPQ